MGFFTKAPPPPQSDTLIGAKTTLKGSLSLRADLRVHGVLEGPITCKGKLTVEPEGRVNGEISCLSLDCGGAAAGRASVKGLASFRPSSCWDGELLAAALAVTKGARIMGKLAVISSKP